MEGRSGSFSSFSLACVLRAMTGKKVVHFFEEKSAPPEKILATPMMENERFKTALNAIAMAHGGRHHMLYQYTQNPLHNVELDAKSALGLVVACKSGVADWSRAHSDRFCTTHDFLNQLAQQFYSQEQHCPKIMMPPQLTTTNCGTFTSSLTRLGSQSHYSTSNFYKRT